MMRYSLLMIVLGLLLLPVAAQDDLDCSLPLEIWQIQGSGEIANCNGERIRLENNIVTGTGRGGFFIQTPSLVKGSLSLRSGGV